MPRRTRSIRHAAGALAASFACIATGACSLLVSTDGLESSGSADATAEAAIDASKDVVIIDATDEIAIDAAPAGFCTTNASALFCDDFDNGVLGAKWDSMQTAEGTITQDGAQFRSTPFSALFTADGNASVVNLERDLTASAGNYRIAFSLRVTTPPSAGMPYQILMRIDNGNGAQLELYEDNSSFSINDRINGTYGTFYAELPALTIGAWADVVIHVTFAASGGQSLASIDVGTNPAINFNIASAFNAPSAVGLVLGIPYGSGSSTVVNIDNVVISTE